MQIEKKCMIVAKILVRRMYQHIKSLMHKERLTKSSGKKINIDLSKVINSTIDKYMEGLMISIRGASTLLEENVAKTLGINPESPIEEAYKDAVYTQKEFSDLLGVDFDYKNDEAIKYLKDRAESFMSEPILKYKNDIERIFRELAEERNIMNQLSEKEIEVIPKTRLDREMRTSTKRFLRSWDLGVKANIAIASASATHQGMVEGFDKGEGVDVVYMTEEDDRVSDWCHSASFNHDGTYKIYKMSDFMPAGYNLSRKRSEWKLCIPPSHFNCYDKETEVLTSEGWKKWPDVTGKEEFLSLDPATKRFDMVKAINLVSYDYTGPIHVLLDEKGVILVTTPGHSHVIVDNNKIKILPGLAIDQTPVGKLIEFNSGLKDDFGSYKETPYSIKTEFYSDMVYCAQLEKNHTMVVRREGRVTVSGNCRSWLVYVPKGFEVQKGGLLTPKK